MSKVFPGDGHVPWSANAAKMNSVDSLVRVFLFNFVCSGVTISGIRQVGTAPELELYPNPANELLNIHSSAAISDILLTDQTGTVVATRGSISASSCEINTSHFAPGVYFLRIAFADDTNAPVVRRILIN